ncbi:hypothetical protein PTI98_000498 [Pleurotus ostreatus]|nr:hypothetical protein PTI98_000498 [Pleurotus ostreatus]
MSTSVAGVETDVLARVLKREEVEELDDECEVVGGALIGAAFLVGDGQDGPASESESLTLADPRMPNNFARTASGDAASYLNASIGLLGAAGATCANDAREDDDDDVEIVEVEGSDGEIRLRGIGLYGLLPALFVERGGQNTLLSGSESSSIVTSTPEVVTFAGTEENKFARIEAGSPALLVVRPVEGVTGTRSSSESRTDFDDPQDLPLREDGVDKWAAVVFESDNGTVGNV